MNRNILLALSGIFVVATLSSLPVSTEAAESEITFKSPNRKFGIRNFEDGRVELVALPSRKTILKLGAFGEIEVSWAPDSRRLTVCESAFDDGTQLYQATVYQLAGDTFKESKLPDVTLPAADWPGKKGRKGAHGREFILAKRWIDANTLVLKRECQCTVYDETDPEKEGKDWSLAHMITIAFDKHGTGSIRKVEKVESTPL